MGRTGRKRKSSIPASSLQNGFYYPLYRGWVSEVTPIFFSASAALCFQYSRYLRDSLWCSMEFEPPWLFCVGCISELSSDSLELCPFSSKSKIETQYFESVTFYKVKPNYVVKSMIVTVSSALLKMCRDTFRECPDYHSSSNSIYRSKCTCIQESSNYSVERVLEPTGVPNIRDDQNMMVIGLNQKFNLKNQVGTLDIGKLISTCHFIFIHS